MFLFYFFKKKKQEATSKKRLMQPIVLLCTALQLTTLAGSCDFHARIHTYIHTYLPFGLCARHPVLNLCFPLLHDAEEIGNCQEKCCARIRKKKNSLSLRGLLLLNQKPMQSWICRWIYWLSRGRTINLASTILLL